MRQRKDVGEHEWHRDHWNEVLTMREKENERRGLASADPATAGTVLDRQAKAVIYSPTQSVMQSGPRLRRPWVLKFAPVEPEHLDPLMGWPGSGDTRQEVNLRFPTRAVAEAYAKHHGIDYEVEEAQATKRPTTSYADNFRWDRIQPWSH